MKLHLNKKIPAIAGIFLFFKKRHDLAKNSFEEEEKYNCQTGTSR